MAKKDKAAEKADTKGKKADKAEKEAAPEFKYGVADLAEALDIEAASVRVRLRNADIEKAGKSYGWNTKKELDEVIDQLKTEKPKAKKADKEPAAEEKKSKKDKGKKKKDKSKD